MTHLEKIKERWAAATPGPWVIDHHQASNIDHSINTRDKLPPYGFPMGVVGFRGVHRAEDAEAIAHAPEDVAWLVTEVERLSKKGKSND